MPNALMLSLTPPAFRLIDATIRGAAPSRPPRVEGLSAVAWLLEKLRYHHWKMLPSPGRSLEQAVATGNKRDSPSQGSGGMIPPAGRPVPAAGGIFAFLLSPAGGIFTFPPGRRSLMREAA